MKVHNILLVSAVILFCTASLSATAIDHTFVSESGSDTNPCTFALPCLTFQAALTNTAAYGLITAKDAGDFGAVSIAQSVTIDGNNVGSVLFSNSKGIDITAAANVIVQNLTINGLGAGGYGITAENGGILTVDNCRFINMTHAGIDFVSAGKLTVENSRIESFIGDQYIYGIEFNNTAAEYVVIKNTVIDATIASNNSTGIFIGGGVGYVIASLQNVTISGAGIGALYSYSGDTQITNSVLTQSAYGVYASQATVSVASSLITSNTTGICSNSGAKIRIDNNDIYDNITAIANCGGIVKTSTTNKTSGTIAIPAADVSDSVTF